MPETTVTITELLPKKSEKAPNQAKDHEGKYWKSWDVNFGLGTFKFDYYEKTREWEGNTYTDYIVKSSELVNGGVPAPTSVAQTNGAAPTRTAENPQTQKSINSAVAMQAAVAAIQHTIPTSATPKDAWEKIAPLYQKIKLELNMAAGVFKPADADEDIPF